MSSSDRDDEQSCESEGSLAFESDSESDSGKDYFIFSSESSDSEDDQKDSWKNAEKAIFFDLLPRCRAKDTWTPIVEAIEQAYVHRQDRIRTWDDVDYYYRLLQHKSTEEPSSSNERFHFEEAEEVDQDACEEEEKLAIVESKIEECQARMDNPKVQKNPALKLFHTERLLRISQRFFMKSSESIILEETLKEMYTVLRSFLVDLVREAIFFDEELKRLTLNQRYQPKIPKLHPTSVSAAIEILHTRQPYKKMKLEIDQDLANFIDSPEFEDAKES